MVKLIVAIGSNNVIGKDNGLIWHLPADMQFFSDTTRGNVVVMGRRNWVSIPNKYRPLPDRHNIVVSRNPEFSAEGCEVFTSIETAIQVYSFDPRDTYIIGGGQIYSFALRHNLMDELLITEIDHAFAGDTYFPQIEQSNWDRELIMDHPIDVKNAYPFKIWRYRKK